MKKFQHTKHGSSFYYKKRMIIGLAFYSATIDLYYQDYIIYRISNGKINWLKHSIKL